MRLSTHIRSSTRTFLMLIYDPKDKFPLSPKVGLHGRHLLPRLLNAVVDGVGDKVVDEDDGLNEADTHGGGQGRRIH